MLASLLPGLREVRTPLTVGYLWLLVIWLAFADKIPTERPAGDNLIARWFDLSGMLGQPATLAALSFLAYVIGAIVAVPTEGPLVGLVLKRLNLSSPARHLRRSDLYLSRSDFLATQHSFGIFLSEEILKVRLAFGAPHFPGDDEEVVATKNGQLNHVELAKNTPLPDLRSRLLVANQEVYGEYDRFAAEGDFRVNLAPPTIFLGIPVAIQFGILWGVGLVLVAGALFVQGTNRLLLADAVLMRAVLDGIIEHPISARAREAIKIVSGMLSGREARAG